MGDVWNCFSRKWNRYSKKHMLDHQQKKWFQRPWQAMLCKALEWGSAGNTLSPWPLPVQLWASTPQCLSLLPCQLGWGQCSPRRAITNRKMYMLSTWHLAKVDFFFSIQGAEQHMHSKHISLDVQESFSSITYTKGQKRMECGGTVGIHTVCTQLRHWSKRRPITFVPDVECDLFNDQKPVVSERTQPTPQIWEAMKQFKEEQPHLLQTLLDWSMSVCQYSIASLFTKIVTPCGLIYLLTKKN